MTLLRRYLVTTLQLLALVVAQGVAMASAASAYQPASQQLTARNQNAFMRVYGPSAPPYGYVQFCELNPAECKTNGGTTARPQMTQARLIELDEVNRVVNRAIRPVTDAEAYGVSEYWTLPTDKGDCEDYALLKRRMLISRGWPESSVLVTVVRDERGDGHAVLTVRTAHGDFVADNKTSEILAWYRTPYQYVMRQSYLNPTNWMLLDPSLERAKVNRSGSRR